MERQGRSCAGDDRSPVGTASWCVLGSRAADCQVGCHFGRMGVAYVSIALLDQKANMEWAAAQHRPIELHLRRRGPDAYLPYISCAAPVPKAPPAKSDVPPAEVIDEPLNFFFVWLNA